METTISKVKSRESLKELKLVLHKYKVILTDNLDNLQYEHQVQFFDQQA